MHASLLCIFPSTSTALHQRETRTSVPISYHFKFCTRIHFPHFFNNIVITSKRFPTNDIFLGPQRGGNPSEQDLWGRTDRPSSVIVSCSKAHHHTTPFDDILRMREGTHFFFSRSCNSKRDIQNSPLIKKMHTLRVNFDGNIERVAKLPGKLLCVRACVCACVHI